MEMKQNIPVFHISMTWKYSSVGPEMRVCECDGASTRVRHCGGGQSGDGLWCHWGNIHDTGNHWMIMIMMIWWYLIWWSYKTTTRCAWRSLTRVWSRIARKPRCCQSALPPPAGQHCFSLCLCSVPLIPVILTNIKMMACRHIPTMTKSHHGGEMSVMIKVGMCQCQIPTIHHDELYLFNSSPVLRRKTHNRSKFYSIFLDVFFIESSFIRFIAQIKHINQ